MNLRALRYFVAMADAGSLTAAAVVLSIAQPALTRQLRELEADLGVQLLQRTGRGVRLTPAGATLYESAQRMLAEAARVRQQLSSQAGGPQAAVALGASPTLTRVLLPGLFERCRHLAGVNLIVREAFTPQLLDALESGRVDLAIVTNPEPTRSLALQHLLVEPFALVTPASRDMAPVVSLAQLAKIPLLMTSLHRGIVERLLAPLGARLQIQAEIDSVDSIRELVLRGQWATIMPVSVFGPERVADVRLSEISGAPLSRVLMLATRLERSQNPAIAVVADRVRSEVTKLLGEGAFSFGPMRQTLAATPSAP